MKSSRTMKKEPKGRSPAHSLDLSIAEGPPPTPGADLDLASDLPVVTSITLTPSSASVIPASHVPASVGRPPTPHQLEETVQPDAYSTAEYSTGDEGRQGFVNFSRRVEKDLAEWLQDNPFIYDKGHLDYKNREKKLRTFELKGAQIKEHPDRIKRWISTKRTQYGKLTKKMAKSGSGRLNLTAKDKWCLQLFNFMEAHISRHRQTKTLGTPQVSYCMI